MIFRVILAYLRKLASQPRGRSAGVSVDSLSRKPRLASEAGNERRFPREEAYMIASVAVDYHVTVVQGTKGVHGMIPKSIFTAQP